MGSPVTISHMSKEDLEEYNKKHAHKRQRKMSKPADWRWPQNRKRDKGEKQS